MLKLTEHVGITIFFLYKQKTRLNFDIQNFYSEILIFLLFIMQMHVMRFGPKLWGISWSATTV